MIVLDEQLLGRNLEEQMAQWYQGNVCFIMDLRPDTVIKDDAIPRLLQRENQPTFVTINERDFWGKVSASKHFCIVCFAFPDTRAGEIPSLLRELLHHPLFNTKKQRMGKVIRVTEQEVTHYSVEDNRIRSVDINSAPSGPA